MTISAEFGPAPKAGMGERISDRLNSILVKEVRQALRGRFFKVSFWFTLVIATIVGLLTVLIMRSELGINSDEVFGPPFFAAMFACLAVATQVLVPFSAFLSMGSEWDENTFDLLVLSNLKPRQIVLGKVLSAGVQSLLFYSAFGPFLVFAFLLRGVDLFAVGATLSISLCGSVLLSCLAVAMSSFGKGRFARLLLMVLLAAALIGSTIGTIVWGTQLTIFPGQLHDPDVLNAIGAMLSIATAVAAFFFAAACARLAHPEENRSSGLRWMTLIGVGVGLGWLTYVFGGSIDEEVVLVGVCLAHGALALASLFYMTEPERLGRRVAVTLPKSKLVRILRMPMLPGGARGLLFFVFGSLLILAWMLLYSIIAEGGEVVFDDGELRVPFALLGYGLIYLGIPSAAFSFHSDRLMTRTIARLVTLAVFIAGMVLPSLIGLLLGIDDWADFEHPFNVFLSIEDVWEGRDRIAGIWPFLIGGSLVSLLLNLPRLISSVRELSAASRRESGGS